MPRCCRVAATNIPAAITGKSIGATALAMVGRFGALILDNRPRSCQGLKLQWRDRLNKLTRIPHGSVLAPDEIETAM